MDRFLIKIDKTKTPNAPSTNKTVHKESEDEDDPPSIPYEHERIEEENIEIRRDSDHEILSENDYDDEDASRDASSSSVSAPTVRDKRQKKIYQQKFKSSWQEDHPWLINKDDKNFCNVCCTVISGAGFHLKRHEQSAMHQKRQSAAKSNLKVTKFLSEGSSLSNSLKNAEMKWSAFLCEKNLPFRLIDSLTEVSASIYPDSTIAKSLKLKRKKATQIVKERLGPTCEKEVMEELRNNCFSLIIDETTDVSTKKSLVVVARYWKDDQVRDIFVKLVEVKDTTGESLFNMIKQLLDENHIPYKNIIGFGADNASTMMGSVRGVQARLRELCPGVVVQGCSCHSLHLCASAASKKLPDQVEQFARDIYSYFSHSSKRLEELKECQVFADEKQHMILYPSQTRWLAMHMVVERIIEQWNPLTLFFQGAALEDNLPSAGAILDRLSNPVYKLYLLFLAHVLHIITKANKEFQSEKPKIPLLLETLTSMYKMILGCFVKRETINNTPIKNILVGNPHNYLDIANIFLGVKVEIFLNSKPKISASDLHNFKLRCLEFYVELCNQIKKRFDFENRHFKFAANFTPRVALSGEKLSIAEAVDLFPQVNLNIEEANMEWQLIAATEGLKKYENSDLTYFWGIVNKSKNQLGEPMFGNLMNLAKIILSLPHSSAAAERVFSQVALIKNKIRNNLSIQTCSDILHVKQSVQLAGSTAKWEQKKTIFKKSEEPDSDSC